MRRNCPICQELLTHANVGKGAIDTYCEECGWPDEVREENPPCVICKKRGVGVCIDTWRCDEHWVCDCCETFN